MRSPPARPAFEEQVMQVVRNLVEYGNYRRDEARAAKALKGRCPDRSLEACRAILPTYIAAYRAGIAFVAEHQPMYDDLRRRLPAARTADLKVVEEGFFDAHPAVPRDLMGSVLFFLHDWHHMR